MSWVSALLHGRVTGSGAVFAGTTFQPPTNIGTQVTTAAQQAAQQAAQSAVNSVVDAASPGAVIFTRNMQIALAVAVAVVLYVVWKKKGA